MQTTPLRNTFRMFALVLQLPGLLLAQSKPDVVVFDEDDTIGVGYYDSSVGIVSGPSVLTRTGPGGDKLPINTAQHFSGIHSGLLQWKSAPNGSWTFFIASPGFQTRNVSGYSNLVLYVNSPRAIAATNLPRVGLESSTDMKTAVTNLGNFISSGIDADTNTWQMVTIPLTAFQPYGQFSLTQFKDVFLSQGAADNVTNAIWLDSMRIVAGESTTNNTPSLSAPTRIVTRSGDRSVVLHWSRNPEANLAGYNVFRSPATNGPLTKITGVPVVLQSYADFGVTNDQAYYYAIRAVNNNQQESTNSLIVSAIPRSFSGDSDFLEYLQQTAFDYFWYEANPTNGLIRDRTQTFSAASIAAVGFGLTAIGIGVDHNWITRAEGRDRTLNTLKTFWERPQGTNLTGTIGYKGWFYHFLDLETGLRSGTTELSSIDTALLLAGILYSKQYFDGGDTNEVTIRALADSIFNRVDWLWMANASNSLAHGWRPDSGFLNNRWIGYNEAMVLYLMGLGAATNPLPATHWESWTSGYNWQTNYGYSFVHFPPLFGHQYSHCWVDFRHIGDAYINAKGITYFENSRRATLAQREYCIANPGQFAGYSSNVWGLTACDGPGSAGFFAYIARGAPPAENDDGTIAPTAAGGSLSFTPEYSLPSLRYFYDQYRTNIWTGYGFRDAFNLQANWWGPDVLGIDQGPIVLMAENYRSQRVWKLFMQNAEIQRGLKAAGFVNLPFVGVGLRRGLEAGTFTVSLNTTSGRSYQVEYSPNLVNWQASPTGFLTAPNSSATLDWKDNGPPATDASPANTPQRFYRALKLGVP